MGLLGLLTSPALGAPRLVLWLARKTMETMEEWDEGRVRAGLLELQARFDLGEVTEEEYDLQEGALLERLKALREVGAER